MMRLLWVINFNLIKKTRAANAVLSVNWSPSFKIWSAKGGYHHEDPVIIFSLTSSRIDSIRASQYLVDLILLSAFLTKNFSEDVIIQSLLPQNLLDLTDLFLNFAGYLFIDTFSHGCPVKVS
jgi:hypothetical protein